MNNSSSAWLTLFICCIYPLLVHFVLLYGVRWFTSRDWQNFQWQNLFKIFGGKDE